MNSPLIRFKDTVETFRQHSKKAYHVHSVSGMLTFMQNEQTPIDHQLVSAIAQQVQQNRELLNMSGKFRGCAALISLSSPRAVYVRCYSHILNLCVAKACDLQVIRNVIGTLNQVCLFFNTSPKCQAILEQVIGRLPKSSSRKTLVDQCRTRWGARHDSFHVFGKLYEAIVEIFEEIVSPNSPQSWNNETVTTANSLKIAITQWQFLIGFVFAKKGLEYASVVC